MTTAVATTSAPSPDRTERRRMDPMRKVALAGGIAYLVTFIASIPQLALFADIIDDPSGFITGTGSNSAVLMGSWLEVITAFACVATAVALYPATRIVSKTAAIGFVTSRVIEASMILVGVLSVLSVVSLKADFAGATGAEAGTLQMIGESLMTVREWTFLIGPGTVVGINALFLGYVMYKGRLVPRAIPMLGLIGAPLILTSATVTLFGGWSQVSTAGALLVLPCALWELSLGLYLTFKGFKTAPAPVVVS